jgi:hypothetical protein
MANRYELNDQQWARSAEMLPGKETATGNGGAKGAERTRLWGVPEVD